MFGSESFSLTWNHKGRDALFVYQIFVVCYLSPNNRSPQARLDRQTALANASLHDRDTQIDVLKRSQTHLVYNLEQANKKIRNLVLFTQSVRKRETTKAFLGKIFLRWRMFIRMTSDQAVKSSLARAIRTKKQCHLAFRKWFRSAWVSRTDREARAWEDEKNSARAEIVAEANLGRERLEEVGSVCKRLEEVGRGWRRLWPLSLPPPPKTEAKRQLNNLWQCRHARTIVCGAWARGHDFRALERLVFPRPAFPPKRSGRLPTPGRSFFRLRLASATISALTESPPGRKSWRKPISAGRGWRRYFLDLIFYPHF